MKGRLFLIFTIVTALAQAAYGATVVPACRTQQDLKRHWMWVGNYAVTCAVTRVVIHEPHTTPR